MPVRSRLVLNNLELTCDAARAGMGIAAVFSYQLANSIRSGELALLLRDFEPPPLPVSLVYPPNRFMPAKLRAFLDFAQPRLKARIGDLPKGCRAARRELVVLFRSDEAELRKSAMRN